MITWGDIYTVLTAVVPLYVAMILAYGSVRWWRIFSPDQCSGINRFVAVFAVPLLSFHFISTNNPYAMNLRFIAADTLQKLLMLAALSLWAVFSPSGSLDWLITIFSLSTLPNTLVMGIPLLIAMYGPYSGSLMVQIVVLQCIIWYTLLLFLFEYRAARILIMDQFPETAGDIVSFKVDSDVVSLVDGHDFLQADAELGENGKLHVTVRKSISSRSVISSRRSVGLGGVGHVGVGGSMPSYTPRPSNLTGAEIYSLSSTPRGSNFNNADFYSMMGGGVGQRNSNFRQADLYSVHSSRGPTPRSSNFDEQMSNNIVNNNNYNHNNSISNVNHNPPPALSDQPQLSTSGTTHRTKSTIPHDAKELHMFVWSSSTSPASEGLHAFGGMDSFSTDERSQKANNDDHTAKEIRMLVPGVNGTTKEMHGYNTMEDFSFKRELEEEEGGQTRGKESPAGLSKIGSSSTAELRPHPEQTDEVPGSQHMPPASVMTRLILIMVWRKLIRNPNTYSSLIGLIWSLVAFRWNVAMPKIIEKSISILSDAGLGMAMFSLGLFMALQPKIIACGNSVAAFAMAVRFLSGPAVMAAASIIVGLRGVLLHVAIVQAALPQGIVPFVFAKEYNVHPAILSTAVIFGMLIALPITLVYYILMGL